MSVLYRANQFWNALWGKPEAGDLRQARQALTPAQMSLFLQLHPSEQAHALQVFRQLSAQGVNHSDLLTAALLHDIGKTRYPLRLWERVWIVLGSALRPDLEKKWAHAEPVGLRRAFVVRACHPAWGAEMAAQAGASPLAVALIRRHQEPILLKPLSLEDHLLVQLQTLDDKN